MDLKAEALGHGDPGLEVCVGKQNQELLATDARSHILHSKLPM
jgi:hypothetical protein